ncbi:hypothetical protein PS662_01536 [Pseudomonas fluorescens]|uniref:Uncharacterized protein n=1 Tax=Pseudomonas fluorescens TaxID=294 RepID=A0A5E6RBX5_PSEFL|nr:hypothetical protein [Pseudomonas fluorescens]VVM65686.1 hypothetical protein PS662_01536 [Pseudomonas fluorescens]
MNTPIGSLLLITSLEKFATCALYGQARALVTQRQQDASTFIDDPATRTLVSGLQGRLQDYARDFLDNLMPDSIASIVDVESLSLVISTLRASRQTGGDDEVATAAQQFYQMIRSDISRAQQNIAALVERTAQSAEETDKVINRLQASIDALTDELAGDKGKIASIQAAIEKTSRDMDEAVSQMLLASQSIGGNTKAIATWVFSLFGVKDEPKKTNDEPKKIKAGDKKPPALDDTPGETRKTESFPVETIGEIARGATEVVDAINSFSAFTDLLQDQYQQLYRQKAALSVAIVIKQQGLDHQLAIERFSEAASSLNGAWTQLDNSWQQALKDSSAVDDHLLDAGWERMAERVDRIKNSLTGTEGQIPRLQRKAALAVLPQGVTK